MSLIPQVQKYDPELHFKEIVAWGEKWGVTYDKDMFPPLGFIVPGICAYFIYETQSKVCWVENLVRNPEVPKPIFEIAINQLLPAIINEINRLGYKAAYATTDNESVINRAHQYNVNVQSNKALLKLYFKN